MEGYIISGVLAVIIAFQQIWITKLINRLMARNYEEFKYYQKKYPKDLKEMNKIRKETRDEDQKKREEIEIQFHDPETIKRLERFDEEWGAEEIDAKKLEEQDMQEVEMTSNDMEKDNK